MTGSLVLLGYGGVARCLLPLLVRDFALDPAQVMVIDSTSRAYELREYLSRGARFHQQTLSTQNLSEVLSTLVRPKDVIVDLTVNIDTWDLVQWCQGNDVGYINASIEEWDPYTDAGHRSPQDRTLYVRHQKFLELRNRKSGPTAVLDHGVNPGLVSHFVKAALKDLGWHFLDQKPSDERSSSIEATLQSENFPELARLLGVKVIHISERDSQTVNLSKRPGEFVNTWSVDGLIEESLAPAELGWGTHERRLPPHSFEHASGIKNQICIARPGFRTLVRSWVPSGDIMGMVIRHGEAYTISEFLSVYEEGRAVYRPTVHYAYCCNDGALASLHELEMRKYHHQEQKRILCDEIIEGHDELGVLLMGHDFNSWWYGSVLDIHQARRLVPGQSATTVQVAAGVAAGLIWLLQNPNQGVLIPDDLPWEEVLAIARPYLGTLVSRPVDWTPAKNREDRKLFGEWNGEGVDISPEDTWQFSSFLDDFDHCSF